MTFRIAHDYFENNLKDQQDDYTFVDGPNGGFHQRIIQQDDLTLSFDSVTDGTLLLFLIFWLQNFFSDILLKYTLAISSTGFQLNDATPIIFVDDSVVFQCKYARSVNANSQMTVSDSSETISGEGDLTYRMDIVAGALGGNTEISISPNHNISGISPR